jgi:hypothetical protein
MDVTRRLRDSSGPLRAALVSVFLATTTAHAQLGNAAAERWRIEQGVDLPGYAAVEPTATSLNIDTVVLACEQAAKSTVLQLQLYLSDDGPLRPLGTSAAELADDPRASISIDAEDYPVSVMFAGDHVLLADDVEGLFPRLSDRLIEAMQAGRTMILQFALLAPRLNRRASFDGDASIELETAGAREAIAAMRHCASLPARERQSGAHAAGDRLK